MNSRAAALFAAFVFLALGAWVSFEGWQKKWGAKGITYRVAGLAALATGAFCGLQGSRR